MSVVTLDHARAWLTPPVRIRAWEWLDAQGRYSLRRIPGGMLRLAKESRGFPTIRVAEEVVEQLRDLLPAHVAPAEAA